MKNSDLFNAQLLRTLGEKKNNSISKRPEKEKLNSMISIDNGKRSALSKTDTREPRRNKTPSGQRPTVTLVKKPTRRVNLNVSFTEKRSVPKKSLTFQKKNGKILRPNRRRDTWRRTKKK